MLCVLTYVFPVLVATALDKNYSHYGNGHYGVVAGDALGQAFHAVFFASATISGVGMFLAEMACDTCNAATMGEMGLIPRIFGKKVKGTTTPYIAILSQWAVVMCLISLPFDSILQVDNLLYCLKLALEIFALFQLRRSRPNVPRPFRIPLEGQWLWIAYIPTFGLIGFVTVMCDGITWVLALSIVISTTILFIVFRRLKKHWIML